MIKWNADGADSIHDFGLGMQCSFPVPIAIGTGRVNGMERRNWGWCPRLCREALCLEWSFSRNEGECAERIMKLKIQ